MKVLILTASAGNGHNSAAKTLTEKILLDYPDAEIKTIDCYKAFTSKLNSWIMSKGYVFACNHMLKMYNYFFRQSEKSNPDNKDTCKAHKSVRCLLNGVINEIITFKPDLIISTYIFVSVALSDLKRTLNIPAKIFALTLDYGISPYWECTTAIDKMFITGEYMKERFLKLGFNDDQLVVSGIPVKPKFYTDANKNEMREKLNLDKSLFTIIVMKSGFFPIKLRALFNEINKIEKPIQIVFVNGRSKKSQNAVQKYIDKKTFKHKAINLGFVNNIDEYFSACDIVLGKAGGLSTTEAITKCIPTIIISKLPSQEIYNKNYLVDNGTALFAKNNKEISTHINNLLNNKQTYNKMVENCKTIRNLKTLDIYAEQFNQIHPATYPADFKNSKNIINDVKKMLNKTI